MDEIEPELTPAIIALSVIVKELLAVLPRRRARRFLEGVTFTMSGRDGWGTIVPIKGRKNEAAPDPAAEAAAWWSAIEPEYRRLIRGR